MQKPKVLFLAEEIRTGGAETYFYELEKNINRDAIDFYSIAVAKPEDYLRFKEGFFFESSFNTFRRIEQIKELVKKYSIDIIHANSLRWCLCAIFASKIYNLRFKIVYTKHNLTALEKYFPRALPKLMNRRIDKTITICNSDYRHFKELGVNEGKLALINNGVDLNRFTYQPAIKREEKHGTTIGILARLSPEKRHDIFLEIVEMITKNNKDTTAFIAGSGPEESAIRESIKEKSLNNKVQMLGTVEAEDFLRKIDYLFLVSDREVLPMSIIEAMATGCLVVARNVGGVSDLIGETTGYLVNSDEAESFVLAFNNASESNNTIILENARNLVEREYSLKGAIAKHEALYTQLA